MLLLWPFLKYRLSYNSYEQLTNAKSCGQRIVYIFKNNIRFKKKSPKTCVFRRDVFYYIRRYIFSCKFFFYRPLVSIISETADIDRQQLYIKSDTLSVLVTTLRKILALQELVSRRLPILIHNIHSEKGFANCFTC